MATMFVRIQVEPGQKEAFESIAKNLAKASVRDEPRLVRYEYWRANAPNEYCVLGIFESFEAFMEHQMSPHHLAASAAFRGVIASMNFEWLDPVTGANSAPPTRPGSGPQNIGDDSDLERSYRERFVVHVPQWWVETA